MKKLILTAMTVLASLSLYAQGTVNFLNNAASTVRYGTDTAPTATPGNGVAVGTSLRISLFYAPTGVTDTNAFIELGTPTTFVAAGRYNGGTRTTPLTTSPGGTAQFEVRVFDSSLGADYTTAYAAGLIAQDPTKFFGWSTPFTSATGGGGAPPGPPVSLATVTPVFVVNPLIPEPSTIALGVLGALGLLFRRRK